MAKRLNVVFDDEALYRAVKVEAAQRGVPAKDIVAAAVAIWLELQEDAQDLAASHDALASYRTSGGVASAVVHVGVEQVLEEREKTR